MCRKSVPCTIARKQTVSASINPPDGGQTGSFLSPARLHSRRGYGPFGSVVSPGSAGFAPQKGFLVSTAGLLSAAFLWSLEIVGTLVLKNAIQ